jgi:hypothetical protein
VLHRGYEGIVAKDPEESLLFAWRARRGWSSLLVVLPVTESVGAFEAAPVAPSANRAIRRLSASSAAQDACHWTAARPCSRITDWLPIW